MIHLKTHTRGHCLLYSFAMCLDVHPDVLIQMIGHDGLEMVTEAEEPYCFRGFAIPELVDVSIELGFAATLIEPFPMVYNGDVEVAVFPRDKAPFRFWNHINRAPRGILLGEGNNGVPHAVAWNGRTIFDPNGREYSLEEAILEGLKMVLGFIRIDKIISS